MAKKDSSFKLFYIWLIISVILSIVLIISFTLVINFTDFFHYSVTAHSNGATDGRNKSPYILSENPIS